VASWLRNERDASGKTSELVARFVGFAPGGGSPSRRQGKILYKRAPVFGFFSSRRRCDVIQVGTYIATYHLCNPLPATLAIFFFQTELQKPNAPLTHSLQLSFRSFNGFIWR